MNYDSLKFDQLRLFSDLDQVSTAIDHPSVVSAEVLQVVSSQITILEALFVEPARYSVADLRLDNSISGFYERVQSAYSIGMERINELEMLRSSLSAMVMLCDDYYHCSIAILAAKNGLINSIIDEATFITTKGNLDRLASLFAIRHKEAVRVIAEIARRTSDIAIFIQDSQPVVFIYSLVLERQRQVKEIMLLDDPDPILQIELEKIAHSTNKVLKLERELVESNRVTRERIMQIKIDRQKRLDDLNPLKLLEQLAQAIGAGLSEIGEEVGDLGRNINIAWNDARREIWIGVENVFREFTVGLCRLQHGSPDKDKDGDGDGKNAGFYKCMDEGWHASVTINGNGEVTDVTVDLPGVPAPVSIKLITDADRRAEQKRIEQQAEFVRHLNRSIRDHFQPGPEINLNQPFFDKIVSDPSVYFKPFGQATFPLLQRDKADVEPYTDKNGKEWPSKRAFKAALTEIHIDRVDSAIIAIQNNLISDEYIQIGAFWFSSVAVYETAVGLVKDVSSATAKGAMTLFAITKDIVSGDDISLRLLVNISNIPLIDTFEAWITLQSWQTDSETAQRSQLELIEDLKEQKILLEENLKDLRGG